MACLRALCAQGDVVGNQFNALGVQSAFRISKKVVVRIARRAWLGIPAA